MTNELVVTLEKFNPKALEFMKYVVDYINIKWPKPGKVIVANEKVFKILLNLFENCYIKVAKNEGMIIEICNDNWTIE